MTRVPGLGAIVLLAAASLPAQAQETKMTGKEITEAVFGNTLSGTSAASGATFNVYIEKSGKARMAANTARGLYRDEGAYAVEGDRLCAAWNNMRGEAYPADPGNQDVELGIIDRAGGVRVTTFAVRWFLGARPSPIADLIRTTLYPQGGGAWPLDFP